MGCESFRRELSAYRDGELAPARRGEVEAHLAGCPECASLLEAMGRADDAFSFPDPGPEYWESFNRRLAERIGPSAKGGEAPGKGAAPAARTPSAEEGRPAPKVLRPGAWGQLRYLVPAAAAALLLVVLRHGSPPTDIPAAPSSPSPPTTAVPAGGGGGGAGGEAPPAPPPGAGGRGAPEARKAGADAAGPISSPSLSAAARSGPERHPPPAVAAERFRLEGALPTWNRTEEPVPVPAPAPPPPLPAARADREGSFGPPGRDGSPPTGGEGVGAARETAAKAEAWRSKSAGGPSAAGVAEHGEAKRREAARDLRQSRAADALADAEARPPVSRCGTARSLAGRGDLRGAEAAQRSCLARDRSREGQEEGLVFLAELLDRQGRAAEAERVIAEARERFPGSAPLSRYLASRPAGEGAPAAAPADRPASPPAP
jgi:anti-sigma factor RsiW